MKFEEGDDVKLTVDKDYQDGTNIPAGTKGVVIRLYPDSESYLVKFRSFVMPRRVPENDLA
jgi:hypothetical protein